MNLSFFKKRWRVVLILAGCALAAILLILLWPDNRPPEPYYQGKSLSEWLMLAAPSPWAPTLHADADESIRQIGTNALPCLVRWLDYQPAWWREKYGSTFVKIKRPRRISDWLLGVEPATRAALALQAFWALGPQAELAIPQLMAMIGNAKRPQPSENAVLALQHMGTNALPAYLKALHSPLVQDRRRAARAIRRFWPQPIMPPSEYRSAADIMRADERLVSLARELPPFLQDSDDEVVGDIVNALRECPLRDETLAPGIGKALRDPRAKVRAAAAWILLIWSDQARPAVPYLTAALSDRDPHVRSMVTVVLRQISPESLTNATPPSAPEQK